MDYNYFKIYRSCILFLFLLLTCNIHFAFGQTNIQKGKITKEYNRTNIQALSHKLEKEYEKTQKKLMKLNTSYTYKTSEILPNGSHIQLMDIGEDNTPLYYTTLYDHISHTSRADQLYSGGLLDLGLGGKEMQVGVWDAGVALKTHQEFDTRVSIFDDTEEVDEHATLVTGTLVSSGVKNKAKGVAFMASAITSDWSRDKIEVAEAAANGLLLSNHSYGIKTNRVPDWYFGAYIRVSQVWDEIMYNAPYYLMVTAAGNAQHSNDNEAPISGVTIDGFDVILGFSASKNGLTVAAAESDIDSNGNMINATVATYSSFGPMDDSRIKPDISGAGTNIFTTSSSGIKNYISSTGTSMATPGVTGTMLLLQEYYERLNNVYMKAATLKGLVLHTADDIQEAGPDYKMGWGVINALNAANTITNNEYSTIISEKTLKDGDSITIKVNAKDDEILSASISWTDPATGFVNRGTLNDITPTLIHDLDVRITKNGEVFYPWKLKASNATAAATKGDNKVDPFERIDVVNASGEYTITISHKGVLTKEAQDFTLIVSGVKLTNCSIDTPSEIAIDKIEESSLSLKWKTAPETLFEVQYKEATATNWITAFTNKNVIILEDLITSTSYELRLRTICSENITSTYSPKLTFSFNGEETELQELWEYGTLSTNKGINISVFPNPAVEEISLEGKLSSKAVYSIITTTGVTVKEGNAASATINVSDLAEELYILTVQDAGGMASIKFYKD